MMGSGTSREPSRKLSIANPQNVGPEKYRVFYAAQIKLKKIPS